MTQWLLEEAAMLAVDLADAYEQQAQAEGRLERDRLAARHAELSAIAARQVGR